MSRRGSEESPASARAVGPSGPADPDRFKHLPPPVRREDLRTSHDVTAHADEVGEADRERAWLLRTTGLPL